MFKKLLACALVSLLTSCSWPVKEQGSQYGSVSPIVLMSDFGTFDDGIAICKGVMLKIQPGLSFVDVTHQIPAYSVKDAARFLANLTTFYPENTVFVVLVERHVEKKTKPIVARNKRGQYFVLSDNGTLSLLWERQEIEKVRAVVEGPWLEQGRLNSTFLGRDVYSPIAARIARGEDWNQVGPEVDKINLLDKKSFRLTDKHLTGEVIALDGPFGNLVTDITATAFLNTKHSIGDKVSVVIGSTEHVLPFVKTFGDVPINEKLIYIDSTDHVAVAINEGSFAGKFKIKPPVKFTIKIKKDKPDGSR